MFCSNCGKEASGKFCSECGAPLAQPETIADQQACAEAISEDLGTVTDSVAEQPASLVNDLWAKARDGAQKQWEKRQAKKRELKDAELREEQRLKERIARMEEEGVAYCPKCYSTSLSAHKKGFGIGKALIGASIQPIGLVAGNIGAKKVRVTCLKCGHQFWAGRRR